MKLVICLLSPQYNISKQDWNTIGEESRPKDYIFIIDLGGHFIYALPKRLNNSKEEQHPPSSSGLAGMESQTYRPPLRFENPPSMKDSQDLKPLSENPLKEFKYLGFPPPYKPSRNYDQQHGEWFGALSGGSAYIRFNPNYQNQLQKCRTKMGLPDMGDVVENNDHLEKIEGAVSLILKELSKPAPNPKTIHAPTSTIRDHAFQLLIAPEKDVRHYLSSPHGIFMTHQLKFRQELQAIEGKESQNTLLSNQFADAIMKNTIEETQRSLLLKHPDRQQLVTLLAKKAASLVSEARQSAEREIENYHKRPEIKSCFDWFFNDSRLQVKYAMLEQGKYASLQEMPNGLGLDKIYDPPYLFQLSSLVKACQKLEQGELRKGIFNGYLESLRKQTHYREVIVPLAFFLEVVHQILLWPKIYEPSEGEWEYLKLYIGHLMLIANKNFPGKIRIAYEYLAISEDKLKNEEGLLKNKKTPPDRKRQACRYLYHAQIPWRALRSVAHLTHRSGEISPQESATKLTLLRSFLVDFVSDLGPVKLAIEELLHFEAEEFAPEPFVQAPKPSQVAYYERLNLLGNFEESATFLKECLDVLNQWDNIPLISQDFKDPKIQYALLRTLQIQGEVNKTLRHIGVLDSNPIWENLEELRDLLSHSERTQTEKRTQELLEKPENQHLLAGLIDDFRTIREFLHHRYKSLQTCTDWKQRLDYFESGRAQPSCFELPTLENILIFFTQKIPLEVQKNLLGSLLTAQAKAARSEMDIILQKTLRLKLDLKTYKEEVQKLPLSTLQKKDVETGVKLHLSPKAAANDARDSKSSSLERSLSIIDNLLQMKKGRLPEAELKSFKQAIQYCKETFAGPEFETKVSAAQLQFEVLRTKWQKNSLSMDKIAVLGENLAYLTEKTDEYIRRKIERLQSILNGVEVNLTDSQVEKKGHELIRKMQLGGISQLELELSLDQLGLRAGTEKSWIDAYKRCRGKGTASNNSEEESSQYQLKHIYSLIEKIQHRIQRLDYLTIKQSRESIMKDHLLFFACQYLISDFRDAASNLELHLESIKYSVSSSALEFVQDIQHNLIFFMEEGNKILHAHDISEPGTLTSMGKRLVIQQKVGSLIYNFSTGKNHDISMQSLFSKLKELQKLLNQTFK